MTRTLLLVSQASHCMLMVKMELQMECSHLKVAQVEPSSLWKDLLKRCELCLAFASLEISLCAVWTFMKHNSYCIYIIATGFAHCLLE